MTKRTAKLPRTQALALAMLAGKGAVQVQQIGARALNALVKKGLAAHVAGPLTHVPYVALTTAGEAAAAALPPVATFI